MTDIPLTISTDYSIDWVNPALLSQPIDNSNDLQTAVILSLCTDRVAPQDHYGLSNFDRRGSWQDVYTGVYGSHLWFGTDANLWQAGSKIAQIIAWCNQSLEWLTDAGLTQSAPTVTAEFISQDSVQIYINVVAADGINRAVTYVLPIS